MRDEHRFGALQMRVAGHDGFACAAACSTSAFAHAARPFNDGFDLLTHIETKIGGDLFVAAAAGVKLQSERTYRSTSDNSTK